MTKYIAKRYLIFKDAKLKEAFNSWSAMPPREGVYKECELVVLKIKNVNGIVRV